MDHYVTGSTVKALREKQGMTQADLAGIPSAFLSRLRTN
ncbi:MAG: helix-turn-helix transcriptional regulator [Clostridia bacterium]|nr:helix-turn-helix transcriptional regulator [Clostridia bacterium]